MKVTHVLSFIDTALASGTKLIKTLNIPAPWKLTKLVYTQSLSFATDIRVYVFAANYSVTQPLTDPGAKNIISQYSQLPYIRGTIVPLEITFNKDVVAQDKSLMIFIDNKGLTDAIISVVATVEQYQVDAIPE